jgi:hypothetical protein
MKVKDILKQKGPEVFTSAKKKLCRCSENSAANNIGVLLVLSSEAKMSV